MSYQTIDTREWHDKYFDAETGITGRERIDNRVADEAYTAVRKVMEENELPISNTDLAEELVAVIYRYIVKSREQAA